MVDMGKRLRALRRSKGLTQAQVAERLGATKMTISAYELGTRYPSLDMLTGLASLFGVSTDYLLGRKNETTVSVEGLSEAQTALIAKLVEELRKHS